MSRDIKFRAWHNKHKEYLEGSVASMFRWLEEGQSIKLEQYTGLKDKDGAEIYEGDIVRQIREDERFGGPNVEVVFAVKEPDYNELLDYISWGPDVIDRVISNEVIGNIHQNPEFLK